VANRRASTGWLIIEGPRGRAAIEIDSDTNLSEVADILHRHLFPLRPGPRPTNIDDIAV
jgi:hypothetical protein